AVLREAVLGDVELRDDLDPGENGRGHLGPEGEAVEHHAVDAVTHHQGLAVPFDVDVARVFADGIRQDLVHRGDGGRLALGALIQVQDAGGVAGYLGARLENGSVQLRRAAVQLRQRGAAGE